MADIFLSYATEDRERIVPLARLLEGCGWSVFWDRKTPIGITWDEYIVTNLEISRCVVVAWSNASVKSKWVRSEARYGLNREACVPLLLERAQPPFPFDQIQAADLSDWRGDAEHRELGDLVAHLRNRLGQGQRTTPSADRNELPVEPAITNADAKIRADQAPLTREQQPSASSSARPESPVPAKPPATDEGSENLKPKIRAPAVWLAAVVGILAVVWFIVPRTGVREQPAVEPPAQGAQTLSSKPYIGVRERAAVEVFRDSLKDGGEAPEMVVIPAGSFLMGSPADEAGRSDDEGPPHQVVVKRFAMSRNEVTYAEYASFAGATRRSFSNGSAPTDDRMPVVLVSWNDAVAYARWLTQATGHRYRLPTEAEWEYAAAAGTQTPYWWGYQIEEGKAHCYGCGSALAVQQPAPVGSFKANPFGLYDTAGNVLEWVQDCYHPSYAGGPSDGSAWETPKCRMRVARGGAYSTPAKSLRSTKRFRLNADGRYDDVGLRVVREPR